MEPGKIEKIDLKRIMSSVEEEMKIKPIEKPQVLVKSSQSDTGDTHVVDLSGPHCSCKDYEYNCGDNNYCKHIYHVVFKKHNML
jgi:hypothetical protein